APLRLRGGVRAMTSDEKTPSFEDALAELERIADRLEDGDIPLDEALALYEKGVQRLRRCHELLEKAERKVSLLSGLTDQAEAIVEPFDDPDLSLEEKAAARRRRRSRPSPLGEELEDGG